MKPKDFGITYEIRKRIKDVKMEQEIYLEYLESEILEIERNFETNKELNFAFAQTNNWDNFQVKMTQNLKKMKTIQKVRYHKGNILLIKHKKYR